ncbi:uncharacterized protein HKW66_Vig0101770 [Vigna angularis]|uniref:Uncharacterized protein n=1 Tax=Phaseolus angularis TaxID=3914 RepID=A0A8T0KLL3_PHAAN|nr:uncharacterized protein HKW66_Vig0101770 [Vigna angularis]
MWKEDKRREVYIGGSNGQILNEVGFSCDCGKGGGTWGERKRREIKECVVHAREQNVQSGRRENEGSGKRLDRIEKERRVSG